MNLGIGFTCLYILMWDETKLDIGPSRRGIWLGIFESRFCMRVGLVWAFRLSHSVFIREKTHSAVLQNLQS